MKKTFLISFLLALCFFQANAQERKISGTITSSDNDEPLIGASVIIKGTTDGTVTDLNGNYTLEVSGDSIVLVISYVGYLDENYTWSGQQAVNVSLVPDLLNLEEVLVVGYGSMRKADLTGSVSSMSEEDLVKTASPNITSTLAGKLTGVITRQESGRPGADSPTFLIRGKSTFDPDEKGTNDPLVLVDGIERDFNRIDPNDIESITLLKDAASAAVYGSRGANGVILVTTKRGTNAKPQVTFSTSYTSQKPTFLPEYMNAGEYAQYLNEASVNKGQNEPFTEEEVRQYQDGTLPSTDWWSEMMSESAPIYQTNVGVNGKSGNTAYFLSFGYLDQHGLYETSSYKRYNLRSNIDTWVSDNFKVYLNFSSRKDNTNASPTGEYKLHQTLQTAIPTIPAFVPEEERIPGDEYGLNYNGTAGSPIGEAIHSGYNKSDNHYLETLLGMQYNFPFLEGLSTKFDYSYDYTYSNGKTFSKPYLLNYYLPETGLTSTVESQSLITLDQETEQKRRQTLQFSFSYDQSFGLHNVSALVLYEQMDYNYNYLWAYRENFLAPTIDQLFAGSDINKSNTGTASENARQGYVGRVNYNYANKYLLQANARYDGSYNFPKDSRWGLFPAFSAGWRISEEAFLKGSDVLSNLKIRASWGKFGNDRVEPFYYLAGYEFDNGYMLGGNYQTGIIDSGIPNENITWETATSYNYGIDFGLFKGKLAGEFDYFHKDTEGILITRSASVPYTFGSDLPKENLGVVENYGLETILTWRERIGNFSYEIGGNVTYATSKVIYIDEPSDVEDRLKQTGRAFDSKFGYTAIGLFQTEEEIANSPIQDGNGNSSIQPGDIKYLDINNDTVIDSEDRHYIGKSDTPELIFGLNFGLGYKGFALTANFQGASNYSRYNYLGSFEKNYNSYKVLEDSWREGNESAKYPRLESNGRSANNSHYSTYWLNDGFYIKLRHIELSYTLANTPYLEKLKMEQVVFSLSARNIWTIAEKDGFDPEGTNNEYPIMQSVSAGLSIVF